MYFLIFIILIVLLVPNRLEKRSQLIIYLKIFISSFIYFYLLNMITTSILVLALTLLTFITIDFLIYRLLKNNIVEHEENNNLYSLAHEVKNPISVCKGYLDMIDVKDTEKLEKYIPIIKSEMNRALSLMNEFLDLKRINLNKDLMDFSLLIEDIKETVDLALENKNINLNIPDTEQELIIDGDYDKLKQVLMNLIKNSYEANAKNINISLEVHKNNLLIRIIDDGNGITKEDLDRIGEVFYTTKATGTGIGVCLSKEIIKLHNGELSYQSTLNKETIATIILPLEYVF